MADKYFKAILCFAFIMVSSTALAQGPPPPPPPVLPIDGGIFGLFALGVGYAVKKIYDSSKN